MSTKDYPRVLKRINEVIQINVMNSEDGDFLATHMPFEHLEVTVSGLGNAQATSMSEEQAYEELVRDAKDDHRFIIVKGNNGTGKSHLIRWMQARMTNDLQNGVIENEKIVFIRRIDNTLRGAIKQLLDQGVVSDSEQLNKMRNFIDSVTNMPEGQLKDLLLDSFISILRNDAIEGKLKTIRKPEALEYVEFLNCGPVRQRLLGPHGPISRLYDLISKPSPDTFNTSVPRFEAPDFAFDRDKEFKNAMQEYRSVQKIYHAYFKLSEEKDRKILAEALNEYVDTVIQRTAHIGGEDTTEIMYNLRKELKKQGKNLTVFIEDMTTFTGIDVDLINILTEGNKGVYTDLCRVTSVIGITDAYYKEKFKGNTQDRVTHQILVDERSFGSPETLYTMAARYLNACYMTSEEVETWLKDGALAKALPYRTEAPEYVWDTVRIGDEDFTLFPFTKQALVRLFDRIESKNRTPRNFLRAIIKEQFTTYIDNQMNQLPFPSVTTDAIGTDPVSFAKSSYNQDFENLTKAATDDEEKRAFRALLCFWGNATVTGDEKSIAGLPREFVNSLQYSFFGPSGTMNVHVQAADVPSSEDIPVKREEPKVEFSATLKKQLEDIDQWVQGSDYILQSSHHLRTCVANFLQEAINWPMEGVPTYWIDKYLRDNKKIYIENQKEKIPTEETALIILPKNVEISNVLKGLMIRNTLKDWNFEESAFYQQCIAIWLEKNKSD